MKLENYINKTKEELEKLTAPQLLRLRNICIKSYRTCGCGFGCEVYGEDAEYNKRIGVIHQFVLEILPHREHVPNKIEAKAARQARAKRRH